MVVDSNFVASVAGSCVPIVVIFIYVSLVSLPSLISVSFSSEGEVDGDDIISLKDCAINSAKRGTSKAVI